MAKKTEVARVRVTQVRSAISCPKDQGATLRALGLKRINHSIEKELNPAVEGMLFKVKHLITVEEL